MSHITKQLVRGISWWNFICLPLFSFHFLFLKAYLFQNSGCLGSILLCTASRANAKFSERIPDCCFCTCFFNSRLLGCSLPNGAKAAVQMLQFICCGKKPGSPRTWLVCVIFLFPFLGVCDRKIPCHWVQLAVLAVMSNNTTESY